MTRQGWYIFGFVLTILGALFLWGLAITSYRRNKDNTANRMLSYDFIFVGLWILCGFIDKIILPPNDTLTLWSFRLAYLFGNIAMIFTFLFAYSLRPDIRIKPALRNICIGAGLIASIISISPLGIENISHTGELVSVDYGLMFTIVLGFFFAFALSAIVVTHIRARASEGIDRARARVVFWILAIIFSAVALFTFILPAATQNDNFTYFSFFITALTPVFCFYAMVRYQLLEVRVIIRKTGLLIIGLFAFSLPIVFLFSLFYLFDLNIMAMAAITIAVLAPIFMLAPQIWQYLQSLTARIFFSGLYDRHQLENKVSTELMEAEDHLEGLLAGLKEITDALGLTSLAIITFPQILHGQSMFLGYERDKNEELRQELSLDYPFPEWLLPMFNETLITEELNREAKQDDRMAAGLNLLRLNLSAAIPCKTSTRPIGWFLVGRKLSRDALSSTDVLFLEQMGLRLGLFLDDYSLSTALLLKVEELDAANEYKKEIIALMAHEFRTPITVAAGVAQLLANQEKLMSVEQKITCLNDLQTAMARLVELVGQAFQISEHQKGNLEARITEMELPVLLNRLTEHYPEEKKRRLFFNFPEGKCVLPTDVEFLFIILRNIVDNALSFSNHDSPVNITIKEQERELVFEIEDFGRGIPEEEITSIFDPFTRIESLEHHDKGAGLGLYISRLYAEELKIGIDVASTLGVGTMVTLHIPAGA